MCPLKRRGGEEERKGRTKCTEVKVTQSCPTLCDPLGYTAHGILQARTLEWVAFPFSRGSSQPRDWTQVSRIKQLPNCWENGLGGCPSSPLISLPEAPSQITKLLLSSEPRCGFSQLSQVKGHGPKMAYETYMIWPLWQRPLPQSVSSHPGPFLLLEMLRHISALWPLQWPFPQPGILSPGYLHGEIPHRLLRFCSNVSFERTPTLNTFF